MVEQIMIWIVEMGKKHKGKGVDKNWEYYVSSSKLDIPRVVLKSKMLRAFFI